MEALQTLRAGALLRNRARADVRDGFIPLCQLCLMHRYHPSQHRILLFFPKSLEGGTFFLKIHSSTYLFKIIILKWNTKYVNLKVFALPELGLYKKSWICLGPWMQRNGKRICAWVKQTRHRGKKRRTPFYRDLGLLTWLGQGHGEPVGDWTGSTTVPTQNLNYQIQFSTSPFIPFFSYIKTLHISSLFFFFFCFPPGRIGKAKAAIHPC